MKDHITSDEILGKQAVDPDGAILGVIIKLHICNSRKSILGITIDQGFMKPDLYVGIDFVRFFGVDAVLLNTAPESKYKGMDVVTSSGNAVGKVMKVIKAKKHLKEFVVEKHSGAFKKESIVIAITQVREIGDRIILKQEKINFTQG